MRKLLLQVIILTLLTGCKTSIITFQTSDPQKIGVKAAKFRGTVFDSTYSNEKLYVHDHIAFRKFTPTKHEIAAAERILKNQIKTVNERKPNQLGHKQYIDQNLNKYFRQYVGYFNKDGHRVIRINMHWGKYTALDRLKGYWDNRLQYTSDYSIVMDGGYRYWNVNVDLTTGTLYNFSVNGVA
jgi:hypothetical protein